MTNKQRKWYCSKLYNNKRWQNGKCVAGSHQDVL